MKGCEFVYLFKIILNKESDSEIIYLYNNWSVASDRFNEICSDVMEKVKVDSGINVNEFLNRMDWEYGFKGTKIECENIINLVK